MSAESMLGTGGNGVDQHMTADQAQRSVTPVGRPRPSRLLRILTAAIPVILGALLIEVCFEAWVQELFGDRHRTADGPVGWLPGWPKDIKNGLLVLVFGASLAKVALERRWRDFRTPADIAIVALGLVMVVAGLIGSSPPTLIAQALFVYFRGAIVFYAWRAWNPGWPRIKPLLWVSGVLVAINVLAAIIQMFIGRPVVIGMGWVDTTWTEINRAQGFFDHPNHLGHVIGIAILGLFAFMVCQPKIRRRWWVAFGFTALALSASQSRESFLAVLVCAFVIWFLRRGRFKTIAIGCSIIVLLFASHLVVRPENITELARRLAGFSAAIELPSGSEDCDPPTPDCKTKTIPAREIRILYAQQGARLWADRPVFGYGVGQFGGIVAYQHDPNWAADPRFGPNGFNTYGFSDITVDSFWLHLIVETGTVGLIAYLVWLVFLALPLVKATRRFAGRTTRGPTEGADAHPTVYWGVSTLIFCVLIAFLSPSLEDPLLPIAMFTVVGMAWVMVGRPATDEGPRHRAIEPEKTTQ
jgi:O-Antigen ligase